MGWKGTLRSVNSSLRAIERENRKRQREQDRIDAINHAEATVEEYNRIIDSLVSIHHTSHPSIDWTAKKSLKKPLPPVREGVNEIEAQSRLDHWVPNWFHRTLGLVERRRVQLQEAVSKASEDDAEHYSEQKAAYNRELLAWEAETQNASDILAFNEEALVAAIEDKGNLDAIGPIGDSLRVTISDQRLVTIEVSLNDPEIIPDYVFTQTQSGKLSKRKLAAGRRNETYFKHVASSLLAVGARVMAVLPLDGLLINGVRNALDPSTGNHRDQCFASIWITRSALESINLKRADADKALNNFLCATDFKKTKGMLPVDPVLPPIESFESSH